MAKHLNTCDASRLRLLLTDQLPESLHTEVADHLAECDDCRRQLELFAGSAEWWSEVESCFREHRPADPVAAPASSPGEGSPFEIGSSADFAVGFLEPCDQANALGRLGEYEILEVIGRGGMGIVLKGFQRELGRYVAVKVMAPHLAQSGTARQRFVREARAAAAIVHPNVMPIHAVCTTTRLPYLVMPFVACESLQQRIDRHGPLELKETLRIGMQVSAGLAAAHAQGLVHRDIKPANILLEKSVDRAMLTDFGLARAADDGSLTRTGVVTGTPQYMSPEQAQGDAVDARSDLFSLGSVLYAMATGRPPFHAETALGVLRRISDLQPRPIRERNPDLPEWFATLVQQLHKKAPSERLGDATELTQLLERCLAHVQQPTVTPLPDSVHLKSSPQSAMHRRPVARSILSIAGTALVAAGVWRAATYYRGKPAETDSSAPVPAISNLTDANVRNEIELLDRALTEFELRALKSWDETTVDERPPLTSEFEQ